MVRAAPEDCAPRRGFEARWAELVAKLGLTSEQANALLDFMSDLQDAAWDAGANAHLL